jgi:hypothetical protein
MTLKRGRVNYQRNRIVQVPSARTILSFWINPFRWVLFSES